MRYQDDINTEHNMKSIGRAAVAQWTKRLTRNGQTERRTFWYYTINQSWQFFHGNYLNSNLDILDSNSND